MPRYKLTIEYDGSPYVGWQRQKEHLSVQQVLEEAIPKFAGETVNVYGAGRTDAGVHALGQVAHIDLAKDFTTDKVRDAMNHFMKDEPVSILQAELVDEEFHARFKAHARHYIYRIVDRRADLTFDRKLAWKAMSPVDSSAMHEAAQCLVGKHDFSTFRDVQCQADSPVKTLTSIDVVRDGDEIEIFVSAPSFLHRQVRSIVGSLMEVGRGKKPVSWMKDILEAADRSKCGTVAPPDGLYLSQVDYP